MFSVDGANLRKAADFYTLLRVCWFAGQDEAIRSQDSTRCILAQRCIRLPPGPGVASAVSDAAAAAALLSMSHQAQCEFLHFRLLLPTGGHHVRTR